MVSPSPLQPDLHKSAKLAVLFYGQLRTGLYCLPWHVGALTKLHVDYSVFVDLQTSNSYSNVKGFVSVPASSPEACKHFAEALPNLKNYEIDFAANELTPDKGYWHYARMFRSLFRVHALAELSGEVFTHYVALRTDCLVGPDNHNLAQFVSSLARDAERNFHSDCGPFVVSSHELVHGTGYGDLVMGARSDVFSSVLGYCSRPLFNQQRSGWAKYPYGPNVMLYKACTWASIGHKPSPTKVALVRPTADLSKPVMDSFPYHEKFWRVSHKGM